MPYVGPEWVCVDHIYAYTGISELWGKLPEIRSKYRSCDPSIYTPHTDSASYNTTTYHRGMVRAFVLQWRIQDFEKGVGTLLEKSFLHNFWAEFYIKKT